MKFKVGDTVTLNANFGDDEGKQAIVHEIEEDKKGRCYYRLMYNGQLDPWSWKDCDFK